MNYRRILLTGGGGFVGSYLAPVIAAAYPEAERLLLRRAGQASVREHWATADVDITDHAAVSTLFASFRPDLILHLAAQASIGASLQSSEPTWRVNFNGSLELATASARHTPEATFFFVSSAEVYGQTFRDGPVDEQAILQPMSAYGRSKAAAEAMLADILPARAQLIIVRPFNHTGPGQDQRFVLPSLAAQVCAIEAGLQPPRIEVGNLTAERDFLDVRDVCAAYLSLLGIKPHRSSREIFNVASGTCYPVSYLIGLLQAQSGVPFEVVVDKTRLRPNDIPRISGLSGKINRTTGWKPNVSLEEIVCNVLNDHRKNILVHDIK